MAGETENPLSDADAVEASATNATVGCAFNAIWFPPGFRVTLAEIVLTSALVDFKVNFARPAPLVTAAAGELVFPLPLGRICRVCPEMLGPPPFFTVTVMVEVAALFARTL